ncbi:uncharacterized protein LOC112550653 [Alligator sinensis]|uniref:Uncharacterized protein LOC112550653 n=1 Tax=Alligator sinensis TaxID=38654 RepID=A0A3Q0GT74_ALLSI|nr:uncharacterized protein LOC112550653 [Alligator sinensis]
MYGCMSLFLYVLCVCLSTYLRVYVYFSVCLNKFGCMSLFFWLLCMSLSVYLFIFCLFLCLDACIYFFFPCMDGSIYSVFLSVYLCTYLFFCRRVSIFLPIFLCFLSLVSACMHVSLCLRVHVSILCMHLFFYLCVSICLCFLSLCTCMHVSVCPCVHVCIMHVSIFLFVHVCFSACFSVGLCVYYVCIYFSVYFSGYICASGGQGTTPAPQGLPTALGPGRESRRGCGGGQRSRVPPGCDAGCPGGDGPGGSWWPLSLASPGPTGAAPARAPKRLGKYRRDPAPAPDAVPQQRPVSHQLPRGRGARIGPRLCSGVRGPAGLCTLSAPRTSHDGQRRGEGKPGPQAAWGAATCSPRHICTPLARPCRWALSSPTRGTEGPVGNPLPSRLCQGAGGGGGAGSRVRACGCLQHTQLLPLRRNSERNLGVTFPLEEVGGGNQMKAWRSHRRDCIRHPYSSGYQG